MSLVICECCSVRLTEDETSRPERICGDCRRTFEAIEQLAPSYKLHVLAAAVCSDRAEICRRLGCGTTTHLSGLGNASTRLRISRARLVSVAAWAIAAGRIEKPEAFMDYSHSIPEASPATDPAVEATPPAGGFTRVQESTGCPAGQPSVEAEPPAPVHCAVDGEPVDQETFDRALKHLADAGPVAHSKGTLASHLPTASARGRLEPEKVIVIEGVRLVPCDGIPGLSVPGKWEAVIQAFLACGSQHRIVDSGNEAHRIAETLRSAIRRGGHSRVCRAMTRERVCYLSRIGAS